VIAAALSFVLSLALTLLAERVARRLGVVARPTGDRWHRKTVPLFGGIGIVAATIGVTLAVAPLERRLLVLALGAGVMAGVGLVDDVRALRPQTKLLAQILLAGALMYFGFALRLTGLPGIDSLITLFWIVGITNAFNLLDNMDGLASAIAMVAGLFRLLFFQWEGDAAGALAAAAFIGAVAGFLVRNFPPARIFMGDTGSLFLGFFLAGLSIGPGATAYSRGVVAVLVIPVLLVLIPIFDTAFVTATRILAGRSPAVGGRDHTSHRLVAVGLSERQTVLSLATISAAGGGVAVLSYRVGLSYAVVLLALLVLGLVLLGIHLSRVRVVHSAEEGGRGAVLRLLADFQYKRQVLTLLLDACLIPLAYYAAYIIRFENDLERALGQFYASLPIVLLVQLGALGSFGLYRGVWQFTSIPDLLRIVRGTAAGTMASVVVLVYAGRFVGFSRTVFILDWVLLLLLIAGSRVSFRLFADIFRARPASFRRVLIYGAGAGGELVVRELLNNPGLERIPVGFIDDDRTKHGTRIHGLPVLGDGEHLEKVAREHGVDEVILSSSKITGAELERAVEVCGRLEIPLRRAALRLE
jgi:UDP-GlcNAc:undecaprenyl-phosphate GlcNAc-1-phosphate transferase